jgi:hypothetical protein
VNAGGVLFSTEWISWSGATNQIINDILPVTYGGFWDNGGEVYTKTAVHDISDGLPSSFDLPVEWSYSATEVDTAASKHAIIIFHGSESGDAVCTGDFGSGKVIHWNMGGHYNGTNIWTENVRRLMLNIVNYGLSINP